MEFKRTVLSLVFAAASLLAADPAVTQAKKELAAKNYDAAITGLQAATKANPKSAEIKATLVEALLAKADSIMYNEALPPRAKYPEALRNYRHVLTVDKENQKAKASISTIEGIYKSMGRPVPQ